MKNNIDVLKEELWNSIQDPREIYKNEIIADIRSVLKLGEMDRNLIRKVVNSNISVKKLLNDEAIYEKAKLIHRKTEIEKQILITLIDVLQPIENGDVADSYIESLMEVWGECSQIGMIPSPKQKSCFIESDVPHDITVPFLLRISDGSYVLDDSPSVWKKSSEYYQKRKNAWFSENSDYAFLNLMCSDFDHAPERCVARLPFFRYMILKIIEKTGKLKIKISGSEQRTYETREYGCPGWRHINLFEFWKDWFRQFPNVEVYRGNYIPDDFCKKIEEITGKNRKNFKFTGGWL
ncbi:MAG: hypothetical protein WA055_06135 [Candidatus Moraniibacteriota bacterium]